MGNNLGVGNGVSRNGISTNWPQWFTILDGHNGKNQLLIKLNRNTQLRAPLDDTLLNGIGDALKNALRIRPSVRSVLIDLHVLPCSSSYRFVPTSREAIRPLINAHLVPYILPSLFAYIQEPRSTVSHIGIPVYGIGPTSTDLLISSITGAHSLISLELNHITEHSLMLRAVQAVTQHNKEHTPITQLKLVYEMDTLPDDIATAFSDLIQTDTLYTLTITKNKLWTIDDYPTGFGEAFMKIFTMYFARVTRLSRLDLSNNRITDRAARWLFKAIEENSNIKLVHLNVARNQINLASVPLLKHCIEGTRNTVIQSIDFQENRITAKTFIRLMTIVERSNSLQRLNVAKHDFNLGAYRLRHGAISRCNQRRQNDPHAPEGVGWPELEVEMSGNAEHASFGYRVALPSWLCCGVCCILQGPFIGKEVTLTNIIQGSCWRRGRAGIPGVVIMIILGMFLMGFALIFPFVIMTNDEPINREIKAALSIAGFMIPLVTWVILILVTAWRDSSGQWTSIDAPVYSARLWPCRYLMKNMVAVSLLFIDLFQLVSLDFIRRTDDKNAMVDPSGQITQIFKPFRLDFGVSSYEYSFYCIVFIVLIWWLMAVYIIASVAVRQPANALNIPRASVIIPLLSNALFLLVVTTLLKSLDCTYYYDDDTGEYDSILDATCSTGAKQVALNVTSCGSDTLHCWRGRHSYMAMMGMISLVWYILSAPTVGTFFSEDHSGATDIQFVEIFTLLERLVKLAMSISVIFFTQSELASPIIVLIAELVLLVATIWLRPCQHIGWVNNMRIGFYCIAIWSGICSLTAKYIIRDEHNDIPLRMLLYGWCTIIGITIIAMIYAVCRKKQFQSAVERLQSERNATSFRMANGRTEASLDATIIDNLPDHQLAAPLEKGSNPFDLDPISEEKKGEVDGDGDDDGDGNGEPAETWEDYGWNDHDLSAAAHAIVANDIVTHGGNAAAANGNGNRSMGNKQHSRRYTEIMMSRLS